ncbi:MAG: hypothetical protein AVO33_06170 [delta proteobacterium ML8_F1]|nr:MAG: hypothetical protein AVO33_06170 [delta proteobacterium ML8_F1]
MSVYYIQTSLTGLAIILLIYINVRKNFSNKDISEHIFSSMLLITALLLVFEMLLNINTGKDSDTSRELMTFIVTVFYILNPFSGAMWLLYVLDFTGMIREKAYSYWAIPLSMPLLLNVVFSIMSIFGDFTFFIDQNNVYHRGSHFWLMPATAYVYLIISLIILIRKRNELSKKEFFALLTFLLPNVVGAIIQINYYGISVVWLMTSFALLIIYIYLQSESIESNRIEQKYLVLFLSTKTVQLIVEPSDGQIINANPAAMNFYGLSLVDLQNKSVDDLSAKDRAFAKYLDGDGDQIFLNRHVAAEGAERDVEIYPAIYNQDRKKLVHLIIVDVTERVLSERKMAEAKKIAEEANAEKDIFLATMSHEIRTPMNGITGSSQLLLTTDLSDEQKKYVSTIQYSINLLEKITNNILDLSKIEANKMVLEHKYVDIADIIQQVSKIVKSDFKHKELDYEVVHRDEFSTFFGDRIRLSQVLLNLLSNAFKFTDKGGIALSVKRLKDEGRRSELYFEVKDTGIGIKRGDTRKIFNRFTQIENSTTRRFEGTGLGLAIAKSLVELMGGEIGVVSHEGIGSCFWFTVWLDKTQGNDFFDFGENADTGSYKPAKGLELASPHPLLLVEDNVIINQLMATQMLEKMGLEVHVAQNGEEALKAYKKNKYAIILMDCHMPVMDGYQATRAIRQLEKDSGHYTPIIALTADAMEENEQVCQSAGMDACITKPIDKLELYRSLKYWLERG